MRAIDAGPLYEKACDLEAQALSHVGKIANDETKIEEWKIWSAILVERTAFKHDVFDAHTIEPERQKGKWIGYLEPGCENYHCDVCGTAWFPEDLYLGGNDFPKFCPECGAEMENWKTGYGEDGADMRDRGMQG